MCQESLRVQVHVDGGARGNPGPAGAGVCIADAAGGQVLYRGGIFIGHATNNVAEYRGMLHGLETAATLGAVEVELFADSQLIVRQMTGQYKVRNPGLKPLYEAARELASKFGKCTFRHVRREQNTRADELVNLAIDQMRNVGDAAGGWVAPSSGVP